MNVILVLQTMKAEGENSDNYKINIYRNLKSNTLNISFLGIETYGS